MAMTSAVPSNADVVIIGGGVVGCSVAYHLTLRGVSDVVLVERKQLTSGTTWHAAGLVGQLRSTQNLTRLAQYTTELYSTLETQTGQATGFDRTGSVAIATNFERLEELKRGASMATLFGLDVETLDRDEARALWPLMNVDDVVGAIHLPGDGQTSPVDTSLALVRGAKARGAKVFENCSVRDIIVSGGMAKGVRTDRGDISSTYVVNCAGMWARELGERAHTTVPLHAAEHFYIVTDVIPGMPARLPVLRDPDGCGYFKGESGKLLVGWFEPVAKPWSLKEIPENLSFAQLPADLDHIEPLLAKAVARVPILEEVGIRLFFNGPESFTPDGRYLVGETPEVRHLFVAAGFNSIGIQSAGGVGKVVADWIVDGHPPMDLWDVEISRCMPFQRNQRYLRDRTVEALGLLYAMHWPFRQAESARGVRRSPLHGRLADRGACFGEVAGWERPNWFAPNGAPAEYRYSYGRQNWFEASAAEHRAVRDAVGLFDQSSFAKFCVEGPDSTSLLSRLSANDIDVPPGRVVYTQWLNERGGIEADLTVTRESEDRYLVVTAAAKQTRDLAWLRRHVCPTMRVAIVDVTSAYAVLGLMGPLSRQLLSTVSDADLSNDGFPFGASRAIDIAYAYARATRITYVGELGWELYLPTECATGVFDALAAEGANFGMRLAGYHAMNSLRMEKAYREWGHDLSDEDSPLEAGLAFAVAWDKSGGFLGREALLRQREVGLDRRLVNLALEDEDCLLYHNEPIWRDGRLVGRVTSGMFGHTVGKSLGMGYVSNPDGKVDRDYLNSGRYEVEVARCRIPATVSTRPPYDERNHRIRGTS